jgi:hypothetical protein
LTQPSPKTGSRAEALSASIQGTDSAIATTAKHRTATSTLRSGAQLAIDKIRELSGQSGRSLLAIEYFYDSVFGTNKCRIGHRCGSLLLEFERGCVMELEPVVLSAVLLSVPMICLIIYNRVLIG